MKLQLLGTGSAAALPAPFCECATCQTARQRGGANFRTRAGALIDEDLKIDLGPDTVMQLQKTGRSMAKVKTILFTHHHNDHVYPQNLLLTAGVKTATPPERIDIYANEITTNKITKVIDPDKFSALNFHLIKAGDEFETAQGDKILAMPAVHEDGAMLFRITRNGKTLFYGHDSGEYAQETIEYLSDGTKLDIALFDCNHGKLDKKPTRPKQTSELVEMAELLRERRAITDNTHCIATHFAHQGGVLHEDLIEAFLPYKIVPAYDGMVINMPPKITLKHTPPRLAALVSGGGTTLDNFVKCIDDGSLKAEISCVIASNASAYKKVQKRHPNLNVHLTARQDYDDVQSFSNFIFNIVRNAKVDLVCLAGFLSLLKIPDDFLSRVINIHPALLPSFGGAGMYGNNVHQAVLDAGCKVSGCTVHFADQDYDTGKIIAQRCCKVKENDTAQTLAARVFEQECIAYPEAINLLVCNSL